MAQSKMRKLLALLSEFHSDPSGSTAVMTAFAAIVFMGVASLAIDMGYLYVIRGKLQTTADAAALAGGTQLPDIDAARSEALVYAEKNMPTSAHGTVLAAADVETGTWDSDARTFDPDGGFINAIRVVVRRSAANGNPAETFFAQMLGYNEIDIETSAVASFGTDKSWDVAIAQDVTGSFSGEIADAVDADGTLLDCIRDNTGPDSQLGITVFTGFGSVLRPLQSVEANYGQQMSSINSIRRCGQGGMPQCSGTHVGAGLESAISLYTDPGYTPAGDNFGQAIIVVGDGDPNARDAAQPYDGSCSGDCNNADLERIAVEQANAADALEISVYTVFFDENNDAAAAAFFESLVRGNGKALRTPDPAELPNLLLDICSELPLRMVD